MINPRVTDVKVLANHALLVSFDSGERRRLELGPLLAYAVFERLLDAAFFSLARADHGTVAWPGGIDLDPDMVYLDSVLLTHPASA
ncbi:MAG: DUF2442 domain-containing protein [Rubrivivax sp.]